MLMTLVKVISVLCSVTLTKMTAVEGVEQENGTFLTELEWELEETMMGLVILATFSEIEGNMLYVSSVLTIHQKEDAFTVKYQIIRM